MLVFCINNFLFYLLLLDSFTVQGDRLLKGLDGKELHLNVLIHSVHSCTIVKIFYSVSLNDHSSFSCFRVQQNILLYVRRLNSVLQDGRMKAAVFFYLTPDFYILLCVRLGLPWFTNKQSNLNCEETFRSLDVISALLLVENPTFPRTGYDNIDTLFSKIYKTCSLRCGGCRCVIRCRICHDIHRLL